ncbi:S-DNA-T family DNA segregation ATPase FtsK/SpoIIIE [Nocardioides zeae]|uniref:S-DNA-T family DNA segregation ATPase FtsK/SpoIIIE n=2 Tax=Nocardioides zeae TaxID=1457234 RepID=A0ACC6IIH6_9ACTN|nr:type VII secretion protein EccCa [Nocardioides zeae]MDR6174514.1 S-DNA-T family DNA segregation ATPase FtsK/SpoIIIE [Nocardioides zeae]MDR6210586.1 S-DNA-T family DNA segregation ATPase FtsK/SpoIIIE [Nocardioides zeae]
MSTTLRSSHRIDAPEVPTGQIVLQPPPQIQEHEGASGVLMNAIPMLGSIGSIVVIASLSGQGGTTGGRSMLAAGMFLFATLGFVAVQIDRQRKQRNQQVTGSRTEYLRYLAGIRQAARDSADRQREALTWHHPSPDALPAVAEDRTRLWERASGDAHFLQVRWGVCPQPLSVELVPPESAPIDQVDPAAASALHRLLVVHRVQPGLPASVDLRAFDRVEVCGPEEQARSLARAMITSAVAFHGPEQVVVAVLSSEANLEHWDWLKWLPHAQSAQQSDAVGPMRMVSTSIDDLGALLPPDLAERPRFGADERAATPHVVLVVDGGILPPGNHVIPPDGLHGVTVIDLPARWEELEDPTRLRLEVVGEESDGRPRIDAIRVRTEVVHGTGDQCSIASAEALARRLTPLHTVSSGDTGESTNPAEMSGPTDFMDMLGLGDVHGYDPAGAWRPRPARDRLRVPIGSGDGGLVHLDIKESAQQGMGPHGLVIGATGSGKSEFLRTLVLGLAMTHSSEQLNMVLVDFKGGATFAGMSEMPHVSAVITNLSQELTLVDRMQDALSGEMVRRQELLREAGNYASIRDYERARAGGEDLAPLPSLFIVVDEFSEMLTAKPEFIDLFVAIGRLGRSLGLHLLLASQRLEEGRLRGLESHLSYRVGLRTFSAGESRAVLGVPDAYELPAVPGLGYLKPDQSTLLRFKAAYVSGPPPASSRATVRRDEGGNVRGILPFTISEVQTLEPIEDEVAPVQEVRPAAQGEQPSLLDIAVDRMHGKGPSAHSVWLPPLDVPDTLDQLMPDLTTTPDAGLVSPHWRSMGGLVVPLGTVDRPREQRRDTLTIDMAGAGGHVAVVGGPRSGKSTLLRTIVTSTALTTTPLESQFFVLDFGGGTFAPLARLPHVAGVGTRAEPDVVRRIVAEVQGIVDRREAYFRNQGIDSIETYRTRRRQGRADDGYGDVFLVVDGWSTLRSDFDDIEMSLQQLAGRGLTFGLHIVVGASRWPDFRAAMRDVFGTRLELRLGDPIDSEIDRKIAALVPTGRPGRGLVPGKLHFLGALPRVDTTPDPATIGDGVDDLVGRVTAAWTGPTGPKLRLLPEQIESDRVLAQAAETPLEGGRTLADSGRILLGVNEKELAPVGLDVDAEPHLLVFGDGRSGKSALLRSYVREVMRTRTPKQAQVVVVDYRRSLLGEVPDEYQLNYLTSAAQATPLLRDLAKYLENRIPGPDVTPDQLRNRSWWQGSEVFVVIDDYDLVSTGQNSPVQPLQPLLAQARDVGLHVVLARRSGGASRALYEPVIQSLRDLAMPGIVLSGSPDEGALIGNVRPQKAPPGRGRLVTRDRGTEVVQLSWSPPTDL